MPDNEVGDRVHNFFAQDNLSQDQYRAPVVEGGWPQLGSNQWAGSQRHIGLPNSSSKNYNLQQSDTEREHGSHSFSPQQHLNLAQSTLRPDPARSQPQVQNPNLNGYMHGNRISQTRQNEANFLGMGTGFNSQNMASRGLSMYESQQGHGPQTHTATMRSESSDSPVGFDFFGGQQQQMSIQQTGMQHSLMLQQSGFGDTRMLQQQAMLRRMQELHRQQQNQQVETSQQNVVHQNPSFAEHASGGHSPALFNGTPIAAASNYPWVTDHSAGNTNWIQNPSSAFQEASNGFRSQPEQNQPMSSMGMVPQHTNQSLFGVPVSRGASHQYSNISLNKPSAQQMAVYSNSVSINQRAGFHDQVTMQEGSVASRQGFQAENMFGNASSQGPTRGTTSDNLQLVNNLQRNAPVHEFHERLQLAGASETLQEKTGMQVSSQNAAAGLDPTEEKILFGDDNIWEAFGSSANPAAGDPLPLNGTDSFSGFPSLQSGSWSALMQSAVAETSSNDTGFQEEWNGLSFQNSDVSAKNRQSSTYEGNADQSMGLAEKNLQSGTALNSGSAPFSTDANASNSYLDIPGFQQSRQNILSSQGEKLKTSTQRPIPQSSEAGNKWLSRGPPQKPLAEETNYGNGAHSLDAQINAKSISGTWAPQQTVSSYNSGQPPNKPDGHEDGDSISGSGDVVSKFRGNLSMGSSQMNGEDFSLRNLAVAPNNSAAGGSRSASQVLPNSQNLNYWRHADSSVQNKGNESSGKFQHHLNNGPQLLESTVSSPGNVGLNLHDMESCDRTENSCDSHQSNFSQHDTPVGSRENVRLDGNDSRTVSKQKSSVQAGRKTSGPRKFQYHPMGNLDEDVERSTGTKQAPLSQGMFQQASRAPFTNQGLFDQSKFYGQSTNTSSEIRKGHPPDQGTKKNETLSRGSLPPNASATFSSPVDTSKDSQSSQNMLELLHKVNQSNEGYSDSFAGHYRQSQSSASQGFGLQLGPPSQGFPIQNRALPSQSSAQTDSFSSSHMTPERREKDHAWSPSPSQLQSLQSSRGTPQGDIRNSQLGASEHTANEALHAGVQGNASASLNSGIHHSGNRVQNQQVVRGSGKVTTNQPMNPSFNRNASYFQQNDSSSSRAPNVQPLTTSFPDTTGLDSNYKPASSEETPQLNKTNDPHRRASSAQILAGRSLGTPQPSVASGISQQGAFRKIVGNAWSSVPGQQQFSGAPPYKFHPSAFQPSESDKHTSTSSVHPNREDHDLQKGGNGPSNIGPTMDSRYTCGEGQQGKDGFHRLVSPENSDLAEKVSASPGKESLSMDTEASPSNSASTQKDIEAFGRSLKPNSLSNQKYSLLQQMRAMKSTEIDPNIPGTKRLKVGDGAVGYQSSPSNEQSREHNATVRDSSVRHGAAPFGDTNMLSFSGPVDNRERYASSQLGNTQPNVNSFVRKDSENLAGNSTVAVRVENSQISPQMAPSWFNQFGTFTKGQMLQMYDARKNATSKVVDQPVRFGTASDGLRLHNSLEQVNPPSSSPVLNVLEKSTPASVAVEQISSSQALAQDVKNQPSVLRKKKRKTATSELLPWHKEVTQSSQSLLSTSAAEVSWAKAANRIKEKVEDIDRQTVLRPKKRLILTTQLMQQLFLPPPAVLLSGDASSNYEAVVYQVARLAMGNTCSVIPCSESDLSVPLDNSNLLPGKHTAPERVSEKNFSQAMEDFLSRARKLENDFVRLDKRASVLDLRIESQDIERFSVINRFAKFHIRGQSDAGETSDASASSQALLLQRYVNALPVPRNLPDRVQCLSL